MNEVELTPRPVREARGVVAGYDCLPWRLLGGGNLNDTYLLHSEHSKLIVRARKSELPVDVEAYLAELVEVVGSVLPFLQFRYRTVTEEITIIEKLSAAKVRVPVIRAYGEDWLAYTFVPGTPLATLLQSSPCVIQISHFLHEVAMANAAGLVCGDRWGGNEIVDQLGNVNLIDFDIEWFGPDLELLKNLDVAVAVAGILRNATFEESCSHVEEALRAVASVHAYDLAVVAMILDRYADFYDNDTVMLRLSLAGPSNLYRRAVSRLRSFAQSIAWGS
ncbi:aminoglycoside phosphotransferase family protein [Rhizobium lemnae]|uniref:Aminoglycoside phosphotransferase family protein n=1 Tax=Rhizobium lemnae TaxID=1214924 RepID=A0ABV8EDQ5_9HYPH|nr:aminoglycoside phosphotransferase family protein [Rhizobium lemnae]MCJ8508673.1 aminoglycoside phosphotransferase family protein [Rhizobium lemnae]